MELNALKSFALESRKQLLKNVNFKIEYVLSENSNARRDNPKSIIELENKIRSSSKEQIVEEVSYTWFNRFIALQYMDINGFNDVQVILPKTGKTRPEILSNAISGVFDNSYISDNTQNVVSSLLDGRSISNNPENDSYKLLLVSFCNKLHSKMPFLFERILDYTELLMPDDLLSKTSIISKIREVMTIDNCQDIEVIGWLYQFYISEKKDEVFADLKKHKKISPENIPSATQLFTPNWIVKYLVENSLGRLWMLNNSNSNLINQMEYYIVPDEKENDFIKINSPEEIKICDPACGSGHMLNYAFDLLYLIYEEEGYETAKIPNLILENNLFGVEIDKRAGDLAAFSLVMKAIKKERKIFKNPHQPNICILENINFENTEINNYMDELGINIYTHDFQNLMRQFQESKIFGSLIEPVINDIDKVKSIIKEKDIQSNLFLNLIHNKVLKLLNQSNYLLQKYDVVITNPPYMGIGNMNTKLSLFAKNNFPDSKSDLFSMFMERSLKMTKKFGFSAMINMQSWMFLSSYEKLRSKLLENINLITMAHIGPRGFDTIGGEIVSTTAFVFKNSKNLKSKGVFLRLIQGNSELEKSNMIKEIISNKNSKLVYKVCTENFKKIPGSPFAYWCSQSIQEIFTKGLSLESVAPTRKGMVTAQNNIYVRNWSEVSIRKSGLDKFKSREIANKTGKKWFSYIKGGGFRKWYGNKLDLINWENDGKLLQSQKHPTENRVWATNFNLEFIFKPNINWGAITSTGFSARISEGGELFDAGGSACFPINIDNRIILGYLNSKLVKSFLTILNPTLNFQAGNIADLPLISVINNNEIINNVDLLIRISREDWNSWTDSWDFQNLPILSPKFDSKLIEKSYNSLRIYWQEMTNKMKILEEKNNIIFINAYGLQDELNYECNLNEITLKCNPNYRYGNQISREVKEDRMREDTIKEFISYSVGCMFGRYSIDKPGLILANSGDSLKEYLEQIPKPSFMPDSDNVIPILELNWFEDDITSRFRDFLRLTFGDEHFEDNIRFIESSIKKDIRKYFLNDFYKDHLRTYKKRPIYWLFSSPKGNFNVLIYMHRYNKDTLSIILEKYLREFSLRLRAEKKTLEKLEINSKNSSREKILLVKDIEKIDSILQELDHWEKHVIFPMASQRLEIDFDDGVKNNYPKFGTALKKVSGLN